MGVGDERNGRAANGEREHKRNDAIGADPMIAHDGKALLRRAPGEAVGQVREAILMQRPGAKDHGGERPERGKRRRARETVRQPIDAAAERADRGADKRIGPNRVGARLDYGERQAMHG